MSNPALLALRQAHETCRAHHEALQEALADLHLRDLKSTDLES